MEQTSAKKTYYVLDIDYTITRAEEFRDRRNNKDFVTLLEKEALGKPAKTMAEPPAYIRHMRKFGIEWEPMSDTGHMRYGPEGAIIIGLVHEYANQVVREIGVPVYNLLGTNMFRLSEKPVKQHADLFGDRLYQLSVDNEEFILRYAACHPP
jgi:threonyl-tRNA synthetase